MKVGTVVCVFAIATSPVLAGPFPAPEVVAAAKVTLPAVPDFAVAPPTDGIHDPKELVARGPAYFGQDVQVRGYVIWIYDCLAAVRTPGESRPAAQKRIDDDPTLCERPKLYLGSTRKTPLDRGLWVVDVPRPPNKLEKERLPAEQLAAWPAVPKIKVGEYVTIRGHFATASPHKERNSDGLVVFASVEPARPSKATKPVPMPLHTGPSPAIPKAPPEPPVAPAIRNDSVRLLNAANALLGAKQPKDALAKYEAALARWPGNDLAGYGAALAHITLRDHAAAVTSLEPVVTAHPDQPMYQLWYAIAAFEATVDAAKQAQKTDEPELSKVDFTAAREHLELALAMNPKLWRAHYYLGKIWRAQGAARDAAGELTRSIEANPREWGPYVALAELYRKWEYADRALAVAEVGTRNARDHVADLFYEIGMAHEARREVAKAIDAYGLALAADAHHAQARFQRGQAYFHQHAYAKAKADLEAFVATSDASLGFARAQANTMLGAIADRR